MTIALTACQSAPTARTVRGVITEVEPRDIAHTEWIKLRTENGEVIQLQVADSVEFTPGHLREHMLFAEPVTVTYVPDPSGATATSITD